MLSIRLITSFWQVHMSTLPQFHQWIEVIRICCCFLCKTCMDETNHDQILRFRKSLSLKVSSLVKYTFFGETFSGKRVSGLSRHGQPQSISNIYLRWWLCEWYFAIYAFPPSHPKTCWLLQEKEQRRKDDIHKRKRNWARAHIGSTCGRTQTDETFLLVNSNWFSV